MSRFTDNFVPLYKAHEKTNASQTKAKYRPYKKYGNHQDIPKISTVNKRLNPLIPSEKNHK